MARFALRSTYCAFSGRGHHGNMILRASFFSFVLQKTQPFFLGLLFSLAFVASFSAKARPVASLIELRPDAPDAPYEIRYSQGLRVKAKLTDEDGQAIAGELVTFHLSRAGESPLDVFQFADAFTGADGVATARLVMAENRHGQDDFSAAVASAGQAGLLYEITARYLPTFFPQNCFADAGVAEVIDAGITDGGIIIDEYCPSETQHSLYVATEKTSLILAPGNELGLEDELTLFATLRDDNGDAPIAGDAIDGSAAKPLANRTITFFYDLDGNGSPSLDERLGTSETASNGVAAFTFVANPDYVVAGLFDTGLFAQFGGDDHYSIAGASAQLLVLPGPAAPEKTLLSAEPDAIPSDSSSSTVITAILIDAFSNPLTVDSPLASVTFSTTEGTLGEVEYDPVTGHYSTTLRASAQAVEAKVTVAINGQEGASIVVSFLPFGCDCDASGHSSAPWTLLSIFITVLWRARCRQRYLLSN